MGRFHPKAGHFLDLQSAGYYASSTTTTTTTTASSSLHSYSYSTSYITPLRLAPRDESTRISLQRQRIQENNHAKALVNASTIPGLKTSAAFFASLRTNLRLHASPPPSPLSTPPSLRASYASLPPPSPLSGPALIYDSAMENEVPETPLVPENPLSGVPELSSYIASEEFEKMEAMKLVADSVAQQRQTANRALILSPINIAILAAVLAFVGKALHGRGYDAMAIGLTCMGVVMTGMLGARWLTQGYINAAEDINFDWLGDADILVTKFGDEVIGTVMIEWVSGESRAKRKKAWRGFIRGWAVRLRYRGKGVGSALLEDAVKQAKQKGAESLEFAEDHANSKRVLPHMYNSVFDKKEQKSLEKLRDLMETSPRGKGRRRLTN